MPTPFSMVQLEQFHSKPPLQRSKVFPTHDLGKLVDPCSTLLDRDLYHCQSLVVHMTTTPLT